MCINCIHCSNAQQSLVIKEVSDRVLRQQQGELTSWLCWKALALTQVRSSRWQVRSDRMGASWLNNSLAYLSAANMNNYRYETIFLLVIIMSIKQFPASYLKSCTHVCFVSKKKKKSFLNLLNLLWDKCSEIILNVSSALWPEMLSSKHLRTSSIKS